MAAFCTKTEATTEFGDFQTPHSLAIAVTGKLRDIGLRPRSILEPTCGRGAFVLAAANAFPEARAIVGVDINEGYIETATARIGSQKGAQYVRFQLGNFFSVSWPEIFAGNEGPWLILGNPPWVTSSCLGALGSDNLPDKSNFHGRAGIEAVTGKSNFDVSEWMLLRYLDWINGSGTIAVLCKTAVARKVLLHVWKLSGVKFSHIYKIDAMMHFGAAVDACLFVLELGPHSNCTTCDVFDTLDDSVPSGRISYYKGHLTSGASDDLLNALWGPETHYVWRSGIKHDCARVMELFPSSDGYRNGLGEHVAIEETFLYPLLKGSDIGNGRTQPRAKMLVTQKVVGQQTTAIEIAAPDTWRYLNDHRALLNKRGSVIYRKNPDFSIFGVGTYTFAPWKLAVSSFYKRLLFVPVGPVEGRTVVFDDTVNFLPCASEKEAQFLKQILHSELASRFLTSMIHWSDKRPLTVDILKRLSLKKLAAALGRDAEYEEFAMPESIEIKQGALSFAS